MREVQDCDEKDEEDQLRKERPEMEDSDYAEQLSHGSTGQSESHQVVTLTGRHFNLAVFKCEVVLPV